MKKLIFCLLITCSINSFGQTPNWAWAQSAGSNFTDGGNGIANDSDGNVYVTGSFVSPSITFGAVTLNNSYPTTADIFLVKYDPAGNVIWARSVGGTDRDEATSVTTDATGNVFITGGFYSSSITFGTFALNRSGNFKTFIAKYDSAGNVIWAKCSGGSGTDITTSIATDNAGNAFVTGYFNSTVTFGSTSLTTTASAVFIAKYDAAGNFLWAKSSTSSISDKGNQVSTDSSGNAYITGTFNSNSITFGSITLTNAGSGGTTDIFLVKFDSAGNVIWAQKAGVGFYYDAAYSVATDYNGDIYVAGYFTALSITFGTTTLYNGGAYDIFIVKYSSAGNVVWAKSAGDASNDEAFSIATDAAGNVYIAGSYTSSNITFGTTVLTNSGARDIFVAKYSSSGIPIWAKSAGGTLHDICTNLSIDVNGNLFITGLFQSASIPFSINTITNGGTTAYYDVFVASLSTSTGTGETETSTEFKIFPNPFTSNTKISFTAAQYNSTVRIFDLVGKKICETLFSGTELHIDKGQMTKGIYILQIQNQQHILTNQKIIIE